MTSPLAHILARHVDRPEDRHRLVLLDLQHLRCVDCTHTLDLSARPSSAQPTSTSTNLPPTKDQACPQHGGWNTNCPGCRADRLAADDQPQDGTA